MESTTEDESKLTRELESLNDNEKEKIIEVLQRDKQLRKLHFQPERIRKLRQEIDLLETDSADIPTEHIKTVNFCARCKQSLAQGFNYFYYSLLGLATTCPKCSHKICQNCRVKQTDNRELDWLCKLCHRYNELKQLLLMSGDWIQDERIAKKKSKSSLSLLSASQLIELTLDPLKKKEILNQVNRNKNSVFKSYSTLKLERRNYTSPTGTKKFEKNKNYSKTTAEAKVPLDSSSNMFLNKSLTSESENQHLEKQDSTARSVQEKNKNLFMNLSAAVGDSISKNPNQIGTISLKQNEIQRINKSLFINSSAAVGESKSTNPNQIGPISLKQNEIHRKNNEHESLLANVKSTLKPSYFKTKIVGDDLNSITSSDYSSRSDIEQTSAVNDFKISNSNAEKSHYLSQQCNENNKNYDSKENNVNNLEQIIPFSKSDHSFNSRNSKISDTEDFDFHFKIENEKNKPEEPADANLENGFINPSTNDNENYLQTDYDLKQEDQIDENIKNKTGPFHARFRKLTRTLSNKPMNSSNTSNLNGANSIQAGKILLKLDYDRKSSNLNVKIVKCENLMNNKKEAYDPYVKMYLILKDEDNKPEKQIEKDRKSFKRKTVIKRNQNSPEFNQIFRYMIAYDELDRFKLKVFVCHDDKFGRNKPIGEVELELNRDDFNQTNTAETWHSLSGLKKVTSDEKILIQRV